MTLPSWLPALASASGALDDAIARLYKHFTEDFKNSGCELRGVPVRFALRIPAGERYEEVFWHLISKEDEAGERRFDNCRARRLPWCKAVIEHADEDAVTVWRDYVKARLRTFLWLRELDYVVVLEEVTRSHLINGKEGDRTDFASTAGGVFSPFSRADAF